MFSDEKMIEIEGLSKEYKIYNTPKDRIKEFFLPKIREKIGLDRILYSKSFRALNDINFSIGKGETVGIIGHNGSGKSTLLQIICGTLNSTQGTVKVNGRIAALLELGAGFNPEFTGRENVYMGCALLGLSKYETTQKFEEIERFADIGEFINQPVKNYSSGMFVRLAFAVNIVSSPDIMIVDEALSVGDMNFQSKCMTALLKLRRNGATILFVSHDINAVKSLCDRAIYLDKGKLVAVGPVVDITERYIRDMRLKLNGDENIADSNNSTNKSDELTQKTNNTFLKQYKNTSSFIEKVKHFRYGNGLVKVLYAEMLDKNGLSNDSFDFNEEVTIKIHVKSLSDLKVSVDGNIHDAKKIIITQCGYFQARGEFLEVHENEEYVIEYKLSLPFEEGIYTLQTYISSPLEEGVSGAVVDVIDDALTFRVGRREQGRFWSKVYLFPECSVTNF